MLVFSQEHLVKHSLNLANPRTWQILNQKNIDSLIILQQVSQWPFAEWQYELLKFPHLWESFVMWATFNQFIPGLEWAVQHKFPWSPKILEICLEPSYQTALEFHLKYGVVWDNVAFLNYIRQSWNCCLKCLQQDLPDSLKLFIQAKSQFMPLSLVVKNLFPATFQYQATKCMTMMWQNYQSSFTADDIQKYVSVLNIWENVTELTWWNLLEKPELYPVQDSFFRGFDMDNAQHRQSLYTWLNEKPKFWILYIDRLLRPLRDDFFKNLDYCATLLKHPLLTKFWVAQLHFLIKNRAWSQVLFILEYQEAWPNVCLLNDLKLVKTLFQCNEPENFESIHEVWQIWLEFTPWHQFTNKTVLKYVLLSDLQFLQELLVYHDFVNLQWIKWMQRQDRDHVIHYLVYHLMKKYKNEQWEKWVVTENNYYFDFLSTLRQDPQWQFYQQLISYPKITYKANYQGPKPWSEHSRGDFEFQLVEYEL